MAVYFMQGVDGGAVKIGFSDNVPARHRQLERHYGKPLAILAIVDGDAEREREIHERFAEIRYGRTEQFCPTAELMEFIHRPLLATANPDAVEAMTPAGFDPDDNDVSVKLDRGVAFQLKQLAGYRKTTAAKLLTDLVRGPVAKAYLEMLRELGGKEPPQ